MDHTSTTTPVIPPELESLYSRTGQNILDYQQANPLGGFGNSYPQQTAPMSYNQNLGYGAAQGLFQGSPYDALALQYALQLPGLAGAGPTTGSPDGTGLNLQQIFGDMGGGYYPGAAPSWNPNVQPYGPSAIPQQSYFQNPNGLGNGNVYGGGYNPGGGNNGGPYGPGNNAYNPPPPGQPNGPADGGTGVPTDPSQILYGGAPVTAQDSRYAYSQASPQAAAPAQPTATTRATADPYAYGTPQSNAWLQAQNRAMNLAGASQTHVGGGDSAAAFTPDSFNKMVATTDRYPSLKGVSNPYQYLQQYGGFGTTTQDIGTAMSLAGTNPKSPTYSTSGQPNMGSPSPAPTYGAAPVAQAQTRQVSLNPAAGPISGATAGRGGIIPVGTNPGAGTGGGQGSGTVPTVTRQPPVGGFRTPGGNTQIPGSTMPYGPTQQPPVLNSSLNGLGAAAQQGARDVGATPFWQSPGIQAASQKITGQSIMDDPAIKAALGNFNQNVAPGIEDNAALMGLGRSTALNDSMAKAQASILEPEYQAAFGREQQRLQNVLGATESELGRRQQSDLAKAQATQALIPMLSSMGQNQYNQRQGAIDTLMQTGATQQGVQQQGYNAANNDLLRRQALSEQSLFAPFGQLATVGSQTQSK